MRPILRLPPGLLATFRWWTRGVLLAVAILGISIPVQWALGVAEPATAPVHGAVGGVVVLTAIAATLTAGESGRPLLRWGIPAILAIVFILGLGRWLDWWANAGLLAVHVVFGAAIVALALHALWPERGSRN